MTDKELDKIEARANAADIPVLVAEVRSLRRALRYVQPHIYSDRPSIELAVAMAIVRGALE